MSPIAAIETEGLTKKFGRSTAVDSVDLYVPQGTVYALLGTNGAGKTTTVRMLATLMRRDGGRALVFGYDVEDDATAVRGLIGVTGQYASVDEDLTARENLMVFGRLVGSSGRAARARAGDLLDEFGLSGAADRAVRHFSGGMRRRLDLAASMITRPRLLFLDEPTTGLDPRTRKQMWETVRQLVSAGSTVLLTTQYLDEADELADHIAVMDRGRVVADGTAAELKKRVGDTSVTLALSDPTCAASAMAICAPFACGDVVLEGAEPRVVVPIAGTDILAELHYELREGGIELDAVTVGRPSLDEVFFALTDVEAHPWTDQGSSATERGAA